MYGISIPVVLGVLLSLLSCQKAKEVNEVWYLSGVDSTNVMKEVSAAIDAWADSYAKMDPAKAAVIANDCLIGPNPATQGQAAEDKQQKNDQFALSHCASPRLLCEGL